MLTLLSSVLLADFSPDSADDREQIANILDEAKVTQERNAVNKNGVPFLRRGAEELRRRGAMNLSEALSGMSGVSIKDYGGIGGVKTVSIRNFGSQHTAVVHDGVLVDNAQNGQVDIGRFALEDLSSLSVETGGSADIFRSARLLSSVGTLTLSSAKPLFDSVGTQFSLQMRYASFNTWNPYFRLNQRLGEGWSLVAKANYINSRGDYPFVLKNGKLESVERRLNSDLSSIQAGVDVYGDMAQRGELQLKMDCYASERGLPGSVVLYTQTPTQRLWDRDIRASALYNVAFSDRWKLRAVASYSNVWNRFTDTDKLYEEMVDDRYLQQEASISTTGLWMPLEALSISLAQDVALSYLDANITHCLYPLRLASYTALSAKYEACGLTAVGSVLGTVVRERVGNGEAAPPRERLSPSVSLSYAIPLNNSHSLSLRASFKESYRLPTFNDCYYPRIGNRKLNPERALQTNFGVVYDALLAHAHKFSFSTDVYYNTVKDKIVAMPSMFVWSMRNVGKAVMTGADVNASYFGKMDSWLSLRASASISYQYAVDVTDSEAKNFRNQLPYTPRWVGSADVGFETPWFTLSYLLQAVGERYCIGLNLDSYRLKPYQDHGLSLSSAWDFGKRHAWRLELGLQALNLGGENYEIIKYYPMPGRNYRITLKISY